MRKGVKGAAIRRTAVNIGLLLTSCLVGLSLCEGSLRFFYQKYRALAEAQFHSDAMRIFTRTPHSREWRNHPDTDVPHSFHHNNLALRQHRDFREADLAAATNIGFLGDSFTENLRMPVQYSFTEPLDYLLNQSGEHFNVLNFGMEGYGPGQSLLHYEHFRHAEDLDHVLYVYYENDLLNIYETGLFHLDETGHLVRNEAIQESWWATLIRRLHISYLVLDVRQRLRLYIAETAGATESPKRGIEERVRDEIYGTLRHALSLGRQDPTDQKDTLEIFQQLIRHWKHVAEQNGSTFSVVLLPSSPPQPVVVDLLTAEAVEVIDLYTCFGDADPAHLQRPWHQSPYRFRGDDMHWNETGNQLAATCLYRFLEEKVGLPRLSEERLRGTLSWYYAAFEDEVPLKTGVGKAEGVGSVERAAAIRGKYLALDEQNIFMERVRKVLAAPEKRIIDSVFDIYLDDWLLLYVKAECQPADRAAPFFLHVIPVDKTDLPPDRRQAGFTSLDVNSCMVDRQLPAYAIRHIGTGQFTDAGPLWKAEFTLDQARGRRGNESAAAPRRTVRSVFDVTLEGRRLIYRKAECRPTDLQEKFFVHVTPADIADLSPARVRHGFENLGFFHPFRFHIDEFGCRKTTRLPAYATRRIRTGQSRPGTGRLWEGEFAMAQAAVEQD